MKTRMKPSHSTKILSSKEREKFSLSSLAEIITRYSSFVIKSTPYIIATREVWRNWKVGQDAARTRGKLSGWTRKKKKKKKKCKKKKEKEENWSRGELRE